MNIIHEIKDGKLFHRVEEKPEEPKIVLTLDEKSDKSKDKGDIEPPAGKIIITQKVTRKGAEQMVKLGDVRDFIKEMVLEFKKSKITSKEILEKNKGRIV